MFLTGCPASYAADFFQKSLGTLRFRRYAPHPRITAIKRKFARFANFPNSISQLCSAFCGLPQNAPRGETELLLIAMLREIFTYYLFEYLNMTIPS